MSCTIVRRDFLKYALASAVVIPTLGVADARAASPPLLDPTDPVAQSLGFVPDASKVAANANPTFTPGQRCGVCLQYQGKAIRRSGWMRHFCRPLGSIPRLVQGVRAAFLTSSLVIVFGSHLIQESFL